jgi:NAD(P)-dependent dehydrogenase (short-subunit alcohol dehydrogenase family)
LALERFGLLGPLNGANAAGKHALEALSETLAMEVRRFGIRVLVVQVGRVATGMYEKQERYFSLGEHCDSRAARRPRTPLRRPA